MLGAAAAVGAVLQSGQVRREASTTGSGTAVDAEVSPGSTATIDQLQQSVGEASDCNIYLQSIYNV